MLISTVSTPQILILENLFSNFFINKAPTVEASSRQHHGVAKIDNTIITWQEGN
jgi:hypothetical protein